MTDLMPGDEVWIRGHLAPPRGDGRKMIFVPENCPGMAIDISCSYPYEDYRGVDPLGKHRGGEPCEVRAIVSLRGISRLVLEVWDDNCLGGAGTLPLDPRMELILGT